MNIKRILRNQLKRKNINGKTTEVHKYTKKKKYTGLIIYMKMTEPNSYIQRIVNKNTSQTDK